MWEKLEKLGIKPNLKQEKTTTPKEIEKEADVNVTSSPITNEISETLKKKGFK